VSFLVAYAVVAFLMRYIKRHDFQVFGYYRIALGGLLLLWYAVAR
jgi:undecaprenyl-diphosphatase